MRFANTNEAQGSRQAATIINEVGTRIFGDRFHPMEIPGLLVVTDAADITNEDGSLNLEMAAAVVQGGGLPSAMAKPDADAPGWVRLRWKSEPGLRAASADLGGAGTAPDTGDPIWIGGSDPGPGSIPEWQEQEHQKSAAAQKKERGPDRRKKKSRLYLGDENRKSPRARRAADNTTEIVW